MTYEDLMHALKFMPAMSTPTIVSDKDFLADSHGARFQDVLKDADLDFISTIDWLNSSDVNTRLELAEIHFDMPAIAGILREYESMPRIKRYYESRDPKQTQRSRQAMGVLIKLHMIKKGWAPTRTKGPLGRRESKTVTVGVYNTERSFSRYFLSAERYSPKT